MSKDTFRPSRTETFEVTINGLLTKRQSMMTEAERLHERIEEIRGDLIALDRTLTAIGHTGDLDAMLPKQRRKMVFSRGELIRAIIDTLRTAKRPMMSREIALAVTALHGVIPDDPQYIAELMKRIAKALQPLTRSGDVVQVLDDSRRAFWQLSHSE